MSFIMTSPTALIKWCCSLFDMLENSVDVSRCLASLSSFSAKACRKSTKLPRLFPQNASCCLGKKQVALRSFKISQFSFTIALWMLVFGLRCSIRTGLMEDPKVLSEIWLWMWAVDQFAEASWQILHVTISHLSPDSVTSWEKKAGEAQKVVPLWTSTVPAHLKRAAHLPSPGLKQTF